MGDKPADLFVDLSSNNRPPTRRGLKKHYRSGRRVLCLKITEGTAYTWDTSHRLSDWWHRLGGVVNHYHFLHPGNAASGTAQADYFWSHVRGDLRDGDILTEDVETAGDTGSEHAAFQKRLVEHIKAAKVTVDRWTYGSAYFLRDNHIRPHGTKLWGAGYPTFPFIPPGWTKKTFVAHQFTSTASGVPGIPGSVDESRLLQPLAHKSAKPSPAPKGWGGWLHNWRFWRKDHARRA